jgi:hypothetical protein
MLGRVAFFVPCIAAMLAIGCTPIRPLDGGDAGSARDAGATGDAGIRFDTGLDAEVSDASAAPDAGCGGPELCNGRDDDCDPTTVDGADEPTIGTTCDGPDADACTEGTMGCTAGALACSDTTGDQPEVCGGTDEDCDGSMDEAGAIGGAMYYVDADHDGYGDTAMPMGACMPRVGLATMGGDCADADMTRHPGAAERCNAIDDDCDAMIDDGNPCSGCTTRTNAGRTYQLCTATRAWDAARTACVGQGYDLASIETASEQAFLAPFATGGVLAGGLWIGLRSDAAGVFHWTDGSTPTYTAWATGEPNLTSSCVRLRGVVMGQWADTDCTTTNQFVCEAP